MNLLKSSPTQHRSVVKIINIRMKFSCSFYREIVRFVGTLVAEVQVDDFVCTVFLSTRVGVWGVRIVGTSDNRALVVCTKIGGKPPPEGNPVATPTDNCLRRKYRSSPALHFSSQYLNSHPNNGYGILLHYFIIQPFNIPSNKDSQAVIHTKGW